MPRVQSKARIITLRPREEILAGRLIRPYGRSNRTPKRPHTPKRARPKRGKRIRAAIISGALAAGLVFAVYRPVQATPGGGNAGSGSPSAPVDLVFHSAFNTATGNGNAALFDTNLAIPWDREASPGSGVLNVAAGNALPNSRPAPPDGITNALQVIRHNVNNFDFMQVGTTDGTTANAAHWTDLADGEIFRWRYYWMMDIPDSEGNKEGDNSNHPVQIPANALHGGAIGHFSSMNDGTQTWAIQVTSHGIPADNNVFILGALNGATSLGDQLPKFVWYRGEFAIQRISSTSFSFFTRIYDHSGILLYGETAGQGSLGDVKNDTGTQVTMGSLAGQFAAPATDDIRTMSWGTNGGSIDYTQIVYWYFTAMAVCKGPVADLPGGVYNEIGPYNATLGI